MKIWTGLQGSDLRSNRFGGEEYAVRAIPDNLFGMAKKELLLEMLDDLADGISTSMTPELIDEKVASMSCKAAVKGNNRLSAQEAEIGRAHV